MALTIPEKIEKQRNQQKKAAERALAKKKAKMNDPKEQEKLRDKQIASRKRSQERQLAKLRDPEHQERQRSKAVAQLEKAKVRTKKTKKKTTSKGLMGRSVSASERRVMDKIGQLPCIACSKHGRENTMISLHHVYGRTKENAHTYVLPLCCYHHDTLLPKEDRERYPDMLPVHAKGKYGGKHQFALHNGTEVDLLRSVYELADLDASALNHLT